MKKGDAHKQKTGKSSQMVSPPVVDLASCNKHKFCKSALRAFTRYLTCLRPIDKDYEEAEAVRPHNVHMSPNYYSEMNDEERNDKLKSAIFYCKQTTIVPVLDKSQLC